MKLHERCEYVGIKYCNIEVFQMCIMQAHVIIPILKKSTSMVEKHFQQFQKWQKQTSVKFYHEFGICDGKKTPSCSNFEHYNGDPFAL
jgi:hypothetical protein